MNSNELAIGMSVKVYGWKTAGFAIFTGKVIKIGQNLVWVETSNGRTFAGSSATIEAKS